MKHAYHVDGTTDLVVIEAQARKASERNLEETMVHHHHFDELCEGKTHEFFTPAAHDKFVADKPQLNPHAATTIPRQTPIINRSYCDNQ